ncbi:MAG: hypothetical protein ACRD0U_11640, partial [Acidimicrobiales bacterium]
AAGGLQLISAVQSTSGFPAAISVPASASLGPKFVCASALGYALNCTDFSVIAAKSSGGGGSLALTGVAGALLLAVALALIVAGRAMIAASRARRRSRIVADSALRERTGVSL